MKPTFYLPILLLLSACRPEAETVDTAAPMARKPSYYESEKRQTVATPVKTQIPALSAIKSQANFDLLSRIYEQGSEYEIPHILFLIDREDDNRTDYINTPKFRLHEHYLATILKPMLSKTELNQQYRNPNRRYLFGTISWQNSTQEYVYEFWEGDKITPELLKLAADRLKDSFYAPLRYKTNSLWQETVAEQSKVPFITQESLIKNFPYLPLNQGKAIGTLRVIAKEDDLYNVDADDIIILKEVPLELPPVAGIISEKPSTALSHVNVLARGWGIPNIYLKDAEKILAPYVGRRIELEADAKQYRVAQTNRNTAAKTFSDDLSLPQPDTSDYSLRSLANLRRQPLLRQQSRQPRPYPRPYRRQQRPRRILHPLRLLPRHDGQTRHQRGNTGANRNAKRRRQPQTPYRLTRIAEKKSPMPKSRPNGNAHGRNNGAAN